MKVTPNSTTDAFQIHNLALRIFTDMGNFELPTQRRVNHMTLTPSVDFAEEDVISPEYHMQDGSVLDMTDPMIHNLRREDTRGARPPRREPPAGRGHPDLVIALDVEINRTDVSPLIHK